MDGITPIFFLFFLSPLLLSCQRFEGYVFYPSEKNFDFGTVNATLYGKKKDWIFYASKGPPYELIMSFQLNKTNGTNVEISYIGLIDDETQNKIFTQENTNPIPIERGNNQEFHINIENILSRYIETTLLVIFTIEKDNKKVSYNIKIPFVKNYKSYFQSIISV